MLEHETATAVCDAAVGCAGVTRAERRALVVLDPAAGELCEPVPTRRAAAACDRPDVAM